MKMIFFKRYYPSSQKGHKLQFSLNLIIHLLQRFSYIKKFPEPEWSQ